MTKGKMTINNGMKNLLKRNQTTESESITLSPAETKSIKNFDKNFSSHFLNICLLCKM